MQARGCQALAQFVGADRRSRTCASRAGVAAIATRAVEAHPEDAAVHEAASAVFKLGDTAHCDVRPRMVSVRLC